MNNWSFLDRDRFAQNQVGFVCPPKYWSRVNMLDPTDRIHAKRLLGLDEYEDACLPQCEMIGYRWIRVHNPQHYATRPMIQALQQTKAPSAPLQFAEERIAWFCTDAHFQQTDDADNSFYRQSRHSGDNLYAKNSIQIEK